MRADFLQEPELEFGAGRHIDIRFGLMDYGPLDYQSQLAPKNIRLGVVGTTETVEGAVRWFERCRGEIAAKPSRQPNLFPMFPGFNAEVAFRSTLVTDARLQRPIAQRLVDSAAGQAGENEIVAAAAELFIEEMRHLVQNLKPDVIVCALPDVILAAVDGAAGAGRGDEEHTEDVRAANDLRAGQARVRLDLHDLLKAWAMELGTPIQVVLPSTYGGRSRRRQRRPELARRVQDEATRAWNIHTALYYKAGGLPWRLVRDSTEYATCYIGISFYKSLSGQRLLTSVAQVFNERGEGVIVRGGTAQISKDDRQVHLAREDAKRLVEDALARYRAEHGTLPARVVLHKTSRYNSEETDGILEALDGHHLGLADLISVHKTATRLYRAGAYPPLRGTLLSLDDRAHVLYTRGSVDFFATYPGMYIPLPMLLVCARTEQTPRYLANEMLALTKMNWNNTQFDGGEPMTERTARQVGSVLRFVDEGMQIAPRYSFYM